ncbi:MAG: universal stress protein [Ardenticatenaceae bacterium]
MFKHLLVPLDGSSLAECVIPHAAGIARLFGSRLTLLHILEQSKSPGSPLAIDPLDWELRRAESASYLSELCRRLEAAGIAAEERVEEGSPSRGILEFARTQDVDLILLSSHGRSGLTAWNVSSVVQKVLQRATTSTMIVRAFQPMLDERHGIPYRTLLVPLDGSQRAENALPLAASLARHFDSRLLLAHIVPVPEMPRRAPLSQEEGELLERLIGRNREEATYYLEQLTARFSPAPRYRLLVDDDVPATLHNLVEEEEIDLVVLSAHGYSGKSTLPFGSVASNFILYGKTPVLIVQDLPAEEIEAAQAAGFARQFQGH